MYSVSVAHINPLNVSLVGKGKVSIGQSLSWLNRKDPDGKDWRQEEEGTTEDEMDSITDYNIGNEFEQAPGDGEGQGSLEHWSPWGHKELDTAERQQQ